MPKTILRLKARVRLYTTTTFLITILLILTSVTFADENQLLFHLKDLKDPGSLAVKLQDTRAVVSKPIVAQLSAETQRLLDEYDGISNPSPALQKALLDDLNRLLQVPLPLRHTTSREYRTQRTNAGTPGAKPTKRRSIGSFKPSPSGRCLSL